MMNENKSYKLGAAETSSQVRRNLDYPLLDSSGKHIGQIDIITVLYDRLIVEGWVLSGLVGLASADQKFQRAPHLPRADVFEHFGDTGFKTPGFQLEMPVSLNHTVFWAEVGGARYVYPLPNILGGELHEF